MWKRQVAAGQVVPAVGKVEAVVRQARRMPRRENFHGVYRGRNHTIFGRYGK